MGTMSESKKPFFGLTGGWLTFWMTVGSLLNLAVWMD